ncbi:SDR family NAD(P)-dependent oxidoreductase [Aquabacterium sp. A7-Y]|uniref:SDR family NAD(P)-dependent oxidoreductase n=1 Tax=Aquabacterium sp. A7-Y TaxID=1349605 RepID=UPI00223DED0D|nr:SDR family NAD(P)-dependent oxidoreductase [Aquabacterium sp. A7-Y]MCW7538529.1 SDR family NAD(P)-dependent oxidoreductase [Aquabacterium sp. A7-Y]
MPNFLEQIEGLSKPQLVQLALGLREEILQLRPDEFVGAPPGSGIEASVYERAWHPVPLARHAGRPVRLLLVTEGDTALPALPGGVSVQLSRLPVEARGGWAPQALAERLREQGSFDAVAYLPASQAATGPGWLDRWCTALALAAAVIRLPQPPRLWLITRHAQWLPGDSAPLDLAQAPLAGLGKSLSLEQAAAWGGCIDIDAQPGALQQAVDEIVHGAEDEVAYRGGVRHVPLLQRFTETLPAPLPLRPEATYLVTGGMGGIGSVLVEHLLKRGVARVGVFGRRAAAAAPARAELLARWRTAYPRSRVELVEADLADAAAVARGLEVLGQGGPQLRGIFHAAGSNEPLGLPQLDRASIERIIGAKALGALHLDRLTSGQALDFQVYFSSIAGSWGTASMAPYAMANRLLDALSAERNRQGRTTRSIAWGPWARVGMIVKQNQGAFAALGLKLIEPAQGLQLLERLMAVERAQLQVVDVDWRRYAQSVTPDKHLRGFGALTAAIPRQAESGRVPAAEGDFSSSAATLALLRDLAGDLVGQRLPQAAETRPMPELGLSSLLSVELSQKIRQRLGVACRPTVVFDHPSLKALAEDLAAKWSQARPKPALAEAEPLPDDGAIAIIGMACALPGADSPQQLWERLEQAVRSGKDQIDPQPAHRFDLDRYWAPDDTPGKAYSLAGGYLGDIAAFDPEVFRLSRREAGFMDPQQRLALQTTWRAFEDAGIDPSTLLAGDTAQAQAQAQAQDAAVFFGIGQNEYGPLCRSVMDGEHTGLMPTGQSMNIIPGRVAHVFGLQGPAIACDTACSSSLVALDAAVQHLRSGRNTLAVVGGVNALVSPDTFVLLAKARALSRQGRCAAFDARADGYVRAEGCVVLVLKRLADARADQDTVHAVIRGSAVNHDGRSSGLTAPSGRAQEAVMRAALRDAGVAAEQVALVEAHGTGTPLGDPIEYHALRAVYADGVPRTAPLQLGTVKAFIGHTEAASGLAGLLKLVACLRRRAVPGQLHFSTLNPYIEASEHIEIAAASRPLGGTGRLLGAVSSFGFSGTNAHVIVERGDEGPSRALAPRRFEPVFCWYTERPLADSTGLAQAFGPPRQAGPACYVRRWQAASAEPGAPVREVLLLRQGEGGELHQRLREALLTRGVRLVEAGLDQLAGLPGRFERTVLCLEPLQPLSEGGMAAWLDGLARAWSALGTATLTSGHLLLVGGSDGFAGEASPHWSALLACLAKERPGFSATLVECQADAAALLSRHVETLLNTREPVCVVSREGVAVPRLARLTPSAAGTDFRLSPGRSYLVSGGLGGVGLSLIGWLLERGARHIVNLNRRAPDAAQAAQLQRLGQAHGARIDTLSVDVADLQSLRQALAAGLSAAPPLAGVFHCAATLDDGLFGQQAWERVEQVLRAKFVGAWNLHLATSHQPLEQFVVFSSLSALLGQAGQSAYALANALAERLVAHRRACGRPGLAIQWGPWSGAGMASRAGSGLASSYRQLGLSVYGAADYLPVLGTLLAMGADEAALPATVGVFGMAWDRYLSHTPPTPLCAGLAPPAQAAPPGPPGGALAQRLSGLAPERRLRQLRDSLKQMVAECLGRADAAASIADGDGFAELGIDSLHATVLHKKLEGELRSPLPPTIAFDRPTAAALADWLAEGPLKRCFAAVPAPAEADDTPLRQRSEEDLARLLAAEIERVDRLGATS